MNLLDAHRKLSRKKGGRVIWTENILKKGVGLLFGI